MLPLPPPLPPTLSPLPPTRLSFPLLSCQPTSCLQGTSVWLGPGPIPCHLNQKCMCRPSVFRGCPSLVSWVKKHPQRIATTDHMWPQPRWPLALTPTEDAGLQGWVWGGSWLSFRERAPCSLSLKEFGSGKGPSLAWKIQTHGRDEVEESKDSILHPRPRSF